jgi:signal transduction histidine kinase
LYTTIGIADLKGNIVCSGVELTSPVNISDRAYFQGVLKNKEFSPGDYIIGRVTGKPVITYAYPVLDSNGNVEEVIFAGIDLAWLNTFFQNIHAPQNTVIDLIENNGDILFRYPNPENWVGKNFSTTNLFKTVIGSDEGTTEQLDLVGVKRLFAYKKIANGENSPIVAVGIPVSVINEAANAILRKGLIIITIVLILASISAWIIGNSLIVRQVRALEEVDRLKTEFISIASHELRTPLTAIRSYADIILEGQYGKISDELREPIKDISESSKRLFNLVSDLLNISRMEQGKIKYDYSSVEINKLLSEVVEIISPIAIEKDIKITIDPNIASNLIKVDANKTKEILNNILSNAVKFTPEKGSVRISSQIKDTGVGIEKSDQLRLFGKFQQVGVSQKSGTGTGLGLFVSKEMAQAMGGDVWLVESAPGKGSTFAYSAILS